MPKLREGPGNSVQIVNNLDVPVASFIPGGDFVLQNPPPAPAFAIHTEAAPFSGVTDSILYIGYNSADTGGRIDTTENAFWFGFESHYYDGVTHWFELNLDTLDAAGNSFRAMAWRQDRNNRNRGDWSFDVGSNSANLFKIESVVNGQQFVFQPSNSSRQLLFRYVGGVGEHLQIGGAGDSAAPDDISIGPNSFGDFSGLCLYKSGGNIGILQGTSFGGGQGMLAIGNRAAAPSSAPSGGGVLYAEGGALKWRGSAGTITQIAPP